MVSAAELARRAVDLIGSGEIESASRLYEEALQLDPEDFTACNSLGLVKLRLGRIDEAIALFERALIIDPQSAEALCNLGNALVQHERFEEALACYEGALALRPRYWAALNNRGNVLLALARHQDAILSYDDAVAMEPRAAAAYLNRGHARFALQRYEEAIADFTVAVELKPDYAEALQARGNALRMLRRDEDAAASYIEAAALSPSLKWVIGDALYGKMQICDWDAYEETLKRILEGVNHRQPVCIPFVLFSVCDDPAVQLSGARTYARENFCAPLTPQCKPHHQRKARKIRVAYLSSKFHDHAGSRLIAGLFELHDKSRFETIGISFGPHVQGGMRARLQQSLDELIDVRDFGDADVAALMRDRQIDIAVDLVGYGENGRPGILALRGAPVQVSFLGYPATMGAEFIDYIIADNIVIPVSEERHYSERIVRLPNTYQVNDSQRSMIAERGPTRQASGLPEREFVFCCFNNSFKITPEVFSVWMRILKKVDNSVLWLLGGSTSVQGNLRKEAEARGINPARIIFAPKVAHQDHLARQRLADLFLDTTPCNAHVTASDALWAGLPLLTCIGRAFASRVAASVLHAMRVPELVASNLAEYEEQAVDLASDPALLQGFRDRIRLNRSISPLFDTDRFRKHLEAAYTKIWDTYQRGEVPSSFEIRG